MSKIIDLEKEILEEEKMIEDLPEKQKKQMKQKLAAKRHKLSFVKNDNDLKKIKPLVFTAKK